MPDLSLPNLLPVFGIIIGIDFGAGHNLGDVFSLVLAMLAFRLAKVSPTLRYTYGYKKSTILVSLLNAVILLVCCRIYFGGEYR